MSLWLGSIIESLIESKSTKLLPANVTRTIEGKERFSHSLSQAKENKKRAIFMFSIERHFKKYFLFFFLVIQR